MATYDLTQTTPSKISTGDILNVPYSGAKKSITLPKGKFKLEVWGAQGGYRSSATYGGKGGYSVGTITLSEPTTVHCYAGGAGNTGGTSGGFNGGGKRTSYPGGGGASDIRIGTDSLLARVIVAGGGGSDGATAKTGMYGGGATGGSSTQNYGTGGYGGAQTGVSNTSWQTTSQSSSLTTQAGAYAGFGFGGNGINRSSGYGGAGGGGWYGGSGSYPDGSGDDDRGGGGGSGFVWTGSNAPSGYLLGSAHYLASASTTAGNASFTAPGGGSETGHSGNGYCRITVIEAQSVPSTPSNFVQTSKDYFEIGLSWGAVECTGYKLYREGTLIYTGTATSYTDTGLNSNSEYTYTLTAYNSDGESEPATLTAKTEEGYVILKPVIKSASLSATVVNINDKVTVVVAVADEIVILEPEFWYSNEVYSGEV